MTSRKTEVFTAYGDQADDALRNWQQIDGHSYEAFAAEAVRRMYLADYRRWARSQTIEVVKGSEPDPTERLFTPPGIRPEAVTVRAKLVHDGDEVNLLDLAGPEGAARLRQIVQRDRVPAATTLDRCDQYQRIADLIEAASVEMGRPVSVREVLERAA